jgi:hypothetical protein
MPMISMKRREPITEEVFPRPAAGGVVWGFAVLAAVIIMVIIGWGLGGGNGRGWGRSDQLAHMMPTAAGPTDGPATRAWKSPSNGQLR